MLYSNVVFGNYYVKKGLVSEENLEQLITEAEQKDKSLTRYLTTEKNYDEQKLLGARSNLFGDIPFFTEFSSFAPNTADIDNFDFEELKRLRLLPIGLRNNIYLAAVDDPLNMEAV